MCSLLPCYRVHIRHLATLISKSPAQVQLLSSVQNRSQYNQDLVTSSIPLMLYGGICVNEQREIAIMQSLASHGASRARPMKWTSAECRRQRSAECPESDLAGATDIQQGGAACNVVSSLEAFLAGKGLTVPDLLLSSNESYYFLPAEFLSVPVSRCPSSRLNGDDTVVMTRCCSINQPELSMSVQHFQGLLSNHC